MSSSSKASSSSQRQSHSLLAQVDDIIRLNKILTEGYEQDFKGFVPGQEGVRLKWLEAVTECQRMKGVLESTNNENSKLNSELRQARTMLDRERHMRKKAERDLADFIKEYTAMALQDNSVTNATLRSRYSTDPKLLDGLNTISEHESDISSELSCSRSDDDLDISYQHQGKQWKRNRPPLIASPEPISAKRRRSSMSTNSKRTSQIPTSEPTPHPAPEPVASTSRQENQTECYICKRPANREKNTSRPLCQRHYMKRINEEIKKKKKEEIEARGFCTKCSERFFRNFRGQRLCSKHYKEANKEATAERRKKS